ncbi:GNAT family N-acetyltransferase [Georgenia muralis]|uniref:Putative acetyltransferase n=1 Tax=Georgenia muralis TaxID=154117 RepID=A0A3N4Z3D8_9MICO|nr:GNAT family N-acetyltransferase [Georgenia muralis]RPF27077.1 putative acetyltransferase [Georgenia muralis]
MPDLIITVEDPRSPEVLRILDRHHAFAHSQSPPEDVHALDVEGLAEPGVKLFGARRGGRLLAIGALKRLGADHAELKSVHTAEEARGQGLGSAVVAHLLDVARAQGYTRVSLETGPMEAFEPARRVYARAGFRPCGPFGDYRPSPHSAFMTIELG